MISITDRAATKVKEIAQAEDLAQQGLRLSGAHSVPAPPGASEQGHPPDSLRVACGIGNRNDFAALDIRFQGAHGGICFRVLTPYADSIKMPAT